MEFNFIRIGTLCTWLFLLTNLAKAQTTVNRSFTGSIVDYKNAPQSNATVILKNEQDTSIVQSTQSNDQGRFTFKNVEPGNYLIKISMIGFETFVRSGILIDAGPKQATLGVIRLRVSPQMLNNVIVKGTTPRIERRIDRTIVNVDQNIANAGSTVLEVMKKLPGVQITTDGQVTLNGRSGINVMIDGKPTYLSASDLATLLNGMPSANVQKIEIMTNPSAKYDASGNAGIINIVKKKNQREGFNGSLNGSYGQGYYGRYNGGISLSYKTDSYNLYLDNSYAYGKDLFNRTVGMDVLDGNNALQSKRTSNNDNITADKAYSPTLGLDLYLSGNTTLSLTGTATVQSRSDQTLSSMNIFDGNQSLTGTEYFSALNKNKPFNYTTGIALARQLDSSGRELAFNLDYACYRNNAQQYNHTSLNDASGSFLNRSIVFLDQSRRLGIYAFKVDYTHPLKGQGRLEVGLKSSYIKANNNNDYYNYLNDRNILDSLQTDYSVNSENINAAYVNIKKTYKRLGIQAGLRAEQTATQGRQLLTGESVRQNSLSLFPTVFFDYKLNEQQGLMIRLGRRIERASYNELIPFRRPLTPALYFQGNPDLKPQITWHGEVAWSWRGELFLTAGYNIDRNYVRTLPYLDSNRVTVTRTPTNIQRSSSWNIDLSYSRKFTNWWTTNTTFSLYQNRFSGQVGNFRLDDPGIPTIYFSSNNIFSIAAKLSAEADFEYNSKRQLVTSSFGAYSTLDIGVRQLLFKSKGAFTIKVTNVFQSESHNVIDRYENLYQYSYFNFYTRAVRVNFSYRFGNGKVAKSRKESSSTDEQKRANR
ncbi:outer membrane beta-barrel protein [Pedobacter sp. KR3-3]|uniref:Outer membrane beta-barrel protein n=1 Tax=Pedobacter albus TaxID=3113905 RepID=A0ABU7I7T6_9SPHI|nr:outer membrane beta-barrel protein [Pedobacter sp. KR3-3]MEE1945294.1 outer membrane beta-barrel protein [Pedobacter sp. KR3-3]